MKRYTFYVLLLSVAAVAACQKQATDEPIVKNGSYVYTVNASIGDADVKSDYDADGKFSWSEGDAISVLFHNGETNKFFTLTRVSGTGNTATFSGTIDDGYTIGASDGTSSDKKIWALFPASASHTYTAGSLPSFYVQPEVDFSATHFSANIPMYALNTAEGNFTFANIASTYKFVVSGIKDGVSKVRFTVYNQTTFGLSGLWPIADDGKYIVNYGYASSGSAKSTLSYISDVTSNQAVFYVSCHGTYGEFQPHITVTNYATGVDIKSFVAGTAKIPNTVTDVQPITLDVSESSGGFYSPIILINGAFSDWDPATNTSLIEGTNFKTIAGDGTYWKEFKVAYDARYIYFYVKRNYNAELWDGGYFWFKFDTDGDVDYDDNKKFYILPFKTVSSTKTILTSVAAQDVLGTASASFSLSSSGTFDANDVIIEVAALRSDIGLNKNDVVGIRSNANKSAGNITITGLTFNN